MYSREISAACNMKSRLAIKFPPFRAGKDVKYPGFARGGMLKLRFDWYITGPDLFYTALQLWQIPSDGSNLRRGIELEHIPQIFKLFLKLTARHKLNQVFTGRELN